MQPNTPDRIRPMPNVDFRVHIVSTFRDKRSAGAVAATDLASADADCDNGAVFHGAGRSQRYHERENSRVDPGLTEREIGVRQRHYQTAHPATRNPLARSQVHMHTAAADEDPLPEDRLRDARALKHRDHAGHLQPRDNGVWGYSGVGDGGRIEKLAALVGKLLDNHKLPALRGSQYAREPGLCDHGRAG